MGTNTGLRGCMRICFLYSKTPATPEVASYEGQLTISLKPGSLGWRGGSAFQQMGGCVSKGQKVGLRLSPILEPRAA